jgi:hypothetical protein
MCEYARHPTTRIVAVASNTRGEVAAGLDGQPAAAV